MAPHIQDPYIRWFMLQPGSPVETTLFTPHVGGEIGPRAVVDMVKRKILIFQKFHIQPVA
jgi:hypothetical protein